MSQAQQPEALRLADALAYCDSSVAAQAARELRTQHARIAELEQPRAALAAVPRPLLLRDIARELEITVPQACIALKPLGNYSTNSAVTPEMARMLRDHFPNPAPMPVAHPHHCTARTADGSCEECEGHAQAMAEWNAERDRLAATPAVGAPQAVLDSNWKSRLLDGRALERDDMGFCEHPELPVLDEGMKPRAFFAALGVELRHTMAEDDLELDEHEAMNDAGNWNAWTPRPPAGEGWKLAAIFDTEDGTAAWWVRDALQHQAQDVPRDVAFEAVRKKFCKLQRYSFLLDEKGNVRRVPDFCGNWVEFEAAHTLFDPVSVDAAITASAAQKGGA